MLYEEIEIQFIRDRARTPGHLSVPCFSLSTFTCFPAAGEIRTFSFIDRDSVWSAKTGSEAPSRRRGALENPGQLSPGQVRTYYLLPSPSQWKRGSENWKSICGKVWYSYFIIFSIIFYSNVLFSIVIPFVQERKQS